MKIRACFKVGGVPFEGEQQEGFIGENAFVN